MKDQIRIITTGEIGHNLGDAISSIWEMSMIEAASSWRTEKVVLIHGFASSRWWLLRLQRSLQAAGFATQSYGYVTLIGDIEAYAQRFAALLRQLDQDESLGRLHLVAHSMGGVVVRRALQLYRPARLGRVVFMASPHRGLYAGRFWGRLCRLLYCRAVAQMSDDAGSYVNSLAAPDFEFAVISAAHDHLVTVESAELAGYADRRIYPTMHTMLLLRRDVAEDVCHYLKHGRFLEISLTKDER
ncbi:MAG: esterase/lipase family protein [Blastopirellula sp. JB062]